MNFKTKKAPIVNNSQRTFKKSITLHFALIVLSIATVTLKAFSDVSDPLDIAFKAFTMLVVGALVSVIVEVFYAISDKKISKFESYKGFVDPINTGLIIALLLPSVTPIYVLVLAVVIGVYIGKLVFGGYGYYIFNPALVGVLFAQISFGIQLTVSGTPLQLLKQAIEGQTIIFNLKDLFIGNYEAIAIGSTSVIILLIIFVYLLVTKVIDFRISGTFLITVFLLTLGIGFVNFYVAGDLSGIYNYVVINMITGLTMFGAVFLVSESVSSPTSRETKIVYAVVVALLTVAVRVLGKEVEGVVFAVLFGNMITPFLNRTVKRSDKKALIKTLIISFVIVVFSAIALGFIVQNNAADLFEAVGGLFL
jgi:electron transport complex protein RnfD